MSILNFSKRKNNKKPIEVFYAWGDPKPTFEWGYIIAQEMFAKRGFRVFKTCANKGNFMKDYNGEECILLNGLIDQDLNGELFWWFINGNPIGDYDDISMDNVKGISEVTTQLGNMRVPVSAMNMRNTKDGRMQMSITIAVNNAEHLSNVIERLKKIRHVTTITRV